MRALAALVLACILAPPVAAQDAPSLPPVPSGPATIRGEVQHPDGAGKVGGLPVVLYALTADGTPGVDNATTDATGAFAFEGVSNAEGTVFLLAVRFADIPFGKRLAFVPDQLEQRVVIEVSDPMPTAQGLRITETRYQLDLGAGGVIVRETHALEVAEGQVAHVPQALRESVPPLFTARLPAGASEFRPVMMNVGDGLEQRGEELLYWGPIYPEGQEVQYEYRLPVGARTLTLEEVLASGSERVVVAVAPGISLTQTSRFREAEAIQVMGRSFRAWEADDFARGEALALSFDLPELRHDPALIALDESTHWLELDDTNLVVSANVALSVSPGSPVVASGSEPLLRVELPPGAELLGVSEDFEALGAERTETGFDLRGPVAPGAATLAYRYRVPSNDGRAEVALKFDRELPVLRVMVADTGVVIDSEQTHRRRPVRQGTRTYLHREAFQIPAGEPMRFGLALIERNEIPRAVSLGLMVLVALASGWMLVAPLRGDDDAPEEVEASALQHERSLVYTSIRDLDHDFETGKLSDEDYQPARAALRARAVELLREEQSVAAGVASADAPKPAASSRFCTSCGAQLDPSWRFCAGCGAAVAEARSGRESAG